MGFFKKKPDPISDRARALNAEIAALESKIKKLNLQTVASQGPRVRSTAFPHGPTVGPNSSPAKAPETIFEEVDQHRLKSDVEPVTTSQHFNELGVRKYDLFAVIERIKKQFRGPPMANPKLVSYLAAGGIQGLRPLRYEKRVARNRFLVLAIIFVLVLLGIFAALLRRH
jgi:hypothetical protein